MLKQTRVAQKQQQQRPYQHYNSHVKMWKFYSHDLCFLGFVSLESTHSLILWSAQMRLKLSSWFFSKHLTPGTALADLSEGIFIFPKVYPLDLLLDLWDLYLPIDLSDLFIFTIPGSTKALSIQGNLWGAWIAEWSSHPPTMNISMLRPGPWSRSLVTTILFSAQA